MNEKEKMLFKALCRFKDEFLDYSLIKYATPSVLGHLFFNRMQGIAYDVLRGNNLLGKVNREFRSSLEAAYHQNVQRNKSFQRCVAELSEILSHCNCRVAMLKGAYLCTHYPEGYRTSNDVDLLVSPRDVTTIGKLLTSAGFKQGSIRNGEFIPATRREIVESKMTRGETVPYIKEVNLPFMRFFEVDINFSLDYKGGNEGMLLDMLSNAYTKKEKGISIPTLSDTDFFLHLCAHLHKEATTLPWIEMHRDMTLYKYCDIYLLLLEMTETQLMKVWERAKQLKMENIFAYAILETNALFDMNCTLAQCMASTVFEGAPHFPLTVISPKEKKMYRYQTQNAFDRFFMESRLNDLKEVGNFEKT